MSFGPLDLPSWFPTPSDVDWEAAAVRSLKGKPVDSVTRTSAEGVTLPARPQAPTEQGVAGLWTDAARDRRAVGWDVRQRVAVGEVDLAAHRLADDVGQGARSVWVVPHGLAQGLAPAAGVALHGLSDLLDMLGAVDLRKHPVEVEAGAFGPGWLATLVAAARELGVPAEQLTGAVVHDPLAVLAGQGRLEGGADAAYDGLMASLRWAKTHAPWVHLAGADASVVAAAGGHRVLQLAWVMACLHETLCAVAARGGTPADLTGRLRVRVVLGGKTFADVAMLRAVRRLHQRLHRAWTGEATAPAVFVHAVGGAVSFSQRDPWINMVRGTSEAAGAALGGADAISLWPYDARWGEAGEASHRLARTTQLALLHESHLARVADPAHGATALEALTDRFAREAWSVLHAVAAQGGALAALQSGWWAEQVAAAATARDRAVATRKLPRLGVSVHPKAGEAPLDAEAATVLHQLPSTGAGAAQAVPQHDLDAAVTALVRGASVPAVGAALRGGGAVDRAPALVARPLGAGWEALRPLPGAPQGTVLLVGLGAQKAHAARLGWTQQVLVAAGLQVVVWTTPSADADPNTLDLDALVAKHGSDHPGAAVCLAGPDAWTAAWLPAVQQALTVPVVVAGKVGPDSGAIHLYAGANLLKAACELREAMGLTVPDAAREGGAA